MVDTSKPIEYLYTIRAQPFFSEQPETSLRPSKIADAIRALKLDNNLIGIKYRYKDASGTKILIENPPPLIPLLAECPECEVKSTNYTQKRHKPDCTLAFDVKTLILNKDYIKELNVEELERYKELIDGPIYNEDDDIPFINIFKLQGKSRELKTGILQLATFVFLINKKVIKAKLYLDDLNFEIQKVKSEMVDDTINTVKRFFINFFDLNFEIKIKDYIPMIKLIETWIPLQPNKKIDMSKNKWKSYVNKSNSNPNSPLSHILPVKREDSSSHTRSFVTDKQTKLTITLMTKTVHLVLTHGTKQQCNEGTTSNNCIFTEETLNPYVNFIGSKIKEVLKDRPIEITKRLNKIFNSYTPQTIFTTKSLKGSTGSYTTAPEKSSKKRPHPYEFFGKCPPTQIFSWEGTSDLKPRQYKDFGGRITNDKKIYFPDCEVIKKEDVILPFEEITLNELKDSINEITDNPKQHYDPLKRTQFVRPSKTISGWMDKFINGNFYKNGKPILKPEEVTSGISEYVTVTTLAEDPKSAVYVHGKQSEFFKGDNSMILDSRVWPGIYNLELKELRKFAECMLKNMRVIEPSEPKISIFNVLPLYYIIPTDSEGKIYNIHIDSIFVKIYVEVINGKRGKATIIERDFNVLHKDVIVTPKNDKSFNNDFDFYAFINDKTIIPVFETPKIKLSSPFKIKSIKNTSGDKELIINDEDSSIHIAFDNNSYVQNHLTKQLTMDFFYTGTHLIYKTETVNKEEIELVYKYRKELVLDLNLKNSEKTEKFYEIPDNIPFKSKVLNNYGKNKWYRFKFAWFEPEDYRYEDIELYYDPTTSGERHTKLKPSFILEPIKELKSGPRDSYLESWNKFYKIVITFAEFYSKNFVT
jgi:hypothetical protein